MISLPFFPEKRKRKLSNFFLCSWPYFGLSDPQQNFYRPEEPSAGTASFWSSLIALADFSSLSFS